MSDVVATDVLIVGAGPSGLTLACSLARAGVSFHLIDKIAQRSPHSRALAIHLRSLEILDQLGAADELLDAAHVVAGVRVHASRKARLEVELFRAKQDGCRFDRTIIIEQDHTERALEGGLRRQGHAAQLGHELVEMVEGEGGVRSTCRDAGGRAYTVESRYVVGCDGAHSTVRHQKQIPFEGDRYDQDFLLADVELTWSERRDLFHAFFDRHGFLAMFPMRHRTRLVTAGGKQGEGDPTLEELERAVARLVPYETRLANPTWLARFRLHHRIARRFTAGRVCLVGDAAHIHSPVGGQGMNTGIGDAWNLGWKLAWALRATDARLAAELLDSYHEERVPFARQLVRSTDRAFNIVSGPTWSARTARAVVAPLVLRVASLFARRASVRRAVLHRVSQLGIEYRGSRLSGPQPLFGRPAGPRPGDRMPDVQVGGRPLHRSLDPLRPTLLATGAAPPATDRFALLTLREPTAEDRQLLGVDDPAFFLVRPDGHLAARARSAAQLDAARLLRYWPA